MYSIADTLASQYGWTLDEIFNHTYLEDVIELVPRINDRKKQDYYILLNIVTNPHRKEKAQMELFRLLSKQDQRDYSDVTLDKSGLSGLKNKMQSARGSKFVVK